MSITPAGWHFERIDDRTVQVICPTFTTPLELSLDSIDRKILAFYGLAADLMRSASSAGPTTDEEIARAAVNAMPSTHPGVADYLLEGQAINNVSLADIVAIWRAASAT